MFEVMSDYSLECDRVAMKRMAASNVLIVGMNGLGVEIGECLLVVHHLRYSTTICTQPRMWSLLVSSR